MVVSYKLVSNACELLYRELTVFYDSIKQSMKK